MSFSQPIASATAIDSTAAEHARQRTLRAVPRGSGFVFGPADPTLLRGGGVPMRRLRWAVVASLLMGSPLVARAQGPAQAQVQSVGITQLPPAVQDTFLAEIGNGRVENLRKVPTASGDLYAGEVISDVRAADIMVDTSGVVVNRTQLRDETPEQRARQR